MLSNLDSNQMWSREGIQQFMHRGAEYTQKGLFAVEKGVQYAGMIKGAYEAGGMALRMGGQVLRVGAQILPLVL
jgi:hypothetical protein